MKQKLAPLLNPETHKRSCNLFSAMKLSDRNLMTPHRISKFQNQFMSSIKCTPPPLVCAYCLEKLLDTFEGNNMSSSHKLNSAIAQAYYAKEQGLSGVTTEIGAVQWVGSSSFYRCGYLGLKCHVCMVKGSYDLKLHRTEVMRTYGAEVIPSPSETMEAGPHPGTFGLLRCTISKAIETAETTLGYRYVHTLGSDFIPSANHAGGLRYHDMNPPSHSSITKDLLMRSQQLKSLLKQERIRTSQVRTRKIIQDVQNGTFET